MFLRTYPGIVEVGVRERKKILRFGVKTLSEKKKLVNEKPRYMKDKVNQLPKFPGKVNASLLRRAVMYRNYYLSIQQLLRQYKVESKSFSSGATGSPPNHLRKFI